MLSQMKKVRDWYTVVTNCKSKKVYLKCHHILIVFKHQHVFFLFSFFKDHVLKGHSANMWASTKNPKRSSVSEKGQTRDMWNRRGEPKLFYTHLRFTADVLNFFFLNYFNLPLLISPSLEIILLVFVFVFCLSGKRCRLWNGVWAVRPLLQSFSGGKLLT